MVHQFYALPLWEMILIMFSGILIWGIVGRVCNKKCGFEGGIHSRTILIWRYVNCGLAVIWTLFIIYMTILDRTPSERELILIPFYSFVEAHVQPEMYRSMLTNVMLFVPFGAFLSNTLACLMSKLCSGKEDCCKRVVITTIMIGALFSLTVESVQYLFELGRAEIDDVITNTLGTGIGALSCLISDYNGR